MRPSPPHAIERLDMPSIQAVAPAPAPGIILFAQGFAAGGCSFSSKSGDTKLSESSSPAKKRVAVHNDLKPPKDNQSLAGVPTLVEGLCLVPPRTYRLRQCVCPANIPDLCYHVVNDRTDSRGDRGARLGAAPHLAMAGVVGWLLRAAFDARR